MRRVSARQATAPPATAAEPRYLQIAQALKDGLSAGRYPVGTRLPTEHALCAAYGASRFTVREAVRILAAAGLVHRKPRAGTIVAALPDETRYTQGLTSVRDLFQYAQSTTLDYVYVGRVGLSREQARQLDAEPGAEWLFALGIRREHGGSGAGPGPAEGRAFGITRLFIHPAFTGLETRLRQTRTAVYALIERDFGVRIQRVKQEIVGIVIDAADAANLGVPAGSPGLRITRAYYDATGRLVEFSDNAHPADRFTYRMQIAR